MKIVYSQLKQLLPDITDNYQQLRDDLTLIGHFASGYEEINSEHIYDLEVRQNRGDCQGYYGVAKDLSVFYNIPLVLPEIKLVTPEKTLDIKVNTPDTNRVMAITLNNIQVIESPEWLKNLLSLHDINSRNNIVDITNYIMLLYGTPSHAFDTVKSTANLIWQNNNNQFSEFITLDGTTLKLDPETLLISDGTKPLSLSFIGGKNSGIDQDSNSILLEIADYNGTRVRNDSRSLKTATEAGTRLEKDLDANLIPLAFNHLVSLVQEFGNGQVTSSIFDYYPNPTVSPKIEFNPQKPSLFSGIEIPLDYSIDSLVRLGCQIEKIDDLKYIVSPPTIRKDIIQEEDLVEEVVRFWGYNKIPLNQPIESNNPGDITPPVLYLIESLQNILVSKGYDEVRTWPLIKEESQLTNIHTEDKNPIYAQNSINAEFPVLRQSLISSLIQQKDQYNRFKVQDTPFFEIGKIYYQQNGEFKENYSLSIYHNNINVLNNETKEIFETLNITAPEIITVKNNFGNFIEIVLDEIDTKDIKHFNNIPADNNAFELTSQLIILDANITLDSQIDGLELINQYSQKIDKNILWNMVITDIFFDQKIQKYKYTFQVTYFNTDDKTAKQIHLKTFDLI